MKNRLYISFITACCIFVLASCHKALDLSPKDKITDQQLWSDQGLVTLYANNFYSQLNSGFNNSSGAWLLGCLTDDAMTANPATTSTTSRFILGNTYTSTNSPMNGLWKSRFQYIRRASLFMQNVDNVPGDPAINTRLKAEVRFLRAYYYYDLVQWFGAVPVIRTVQSEDDSIWVPKNTLAECYDYMIEQLDSASLDLPATYAASDAGRITKQAAWGLKCRVQMLKQDWTAAAATAKAIMSLNVNSLQSNYSTLFTSANNAEMLLSVQHNASKDELGTNFDKNTQAPQANGTGSNCPTQNLVDAYEMLKGKTFDPAKPYLNRDSRFAATIYYDSAAFKGRFMQLYTGGIDIDPNAKPNNTSTVTPTGYYLKKFVNENLNVSDANVRSSYNWPIIRYAEVLLNYAEAQNEAAGPDQSIYDAINLVRKRGGIADIVGPLTQSQLRDTIRHERRIEFAFEDSRYWDVKRWGLAQQLFDNTTNPLRKVTITRNATTGVKTYVYSNVAGITRVFQTRNYLFPIPSEEITKVNNKIQQNNGW